MERTILWSWQKGFLDEQGTNDLVMLGYLDDWELGVVDLGGGIVES